ncbi:hypothetical protein ACWT_7687 [Actinoplanes sp. SE50]|uniref:DUF2231 domain-containing protein n=1 Tax=unclassified Actinoplanes TaxID=2626549 RepID=UPI00023EDE14|nr:MULTISPECIES: DUF2231 domain-containing protein [unclassified Actinoplanes]AEV88698.1 hypothetical protein ACPL_7818 [Actinoplanes sp. SE50/110]ATO87102.1 hypothetical protein ACWT_7687 [Actinoplanes sp. SE50]SLM04520.1 uncharacterized protein ACSP50_7827 [Actinoplanes sp. SE50/110]
MFDQVNGLPVHALVLHAAVVFVPLLALGAVVYALAAAWRPRLGWAVAILAVVAPLSTFVAKESGEKLYDRLASHGLKGKGLEILNDHMDYGSMTLWFALGLGVVSLVLVGLTYRGGRRLPLVANAAFAVVILALAVGSGYYIFKTGDSGATAVWGSY